MKKIGVLVVTYNQKDLTLNWIKEFRKTFTGQDNLYLLVLNNNSCDGTYHAVRRRYPDVDIRKLNDNYGCTTGRNIGIVELINLGNEYICTLDNDCFIEDGEFFQKMLRAFDANPDVDGYSAIVRYGDDRTIDTMGSRKKWYGIRRAVKKATKNTKVDYFSGGACIIRSSAFGKYGLYDNDYPPVGGQDHAWGLRVSDKGANLHFNPRTEVFHYHPHIGCYINNPEKDKFLIQGKVVHLRKRFGLIQLLIDIRDSRHYLFEYGPRFLLNNCYAGLRIKFHRDNYNFETFVAQGMEKYYAKI